MKMPGFTAEAVVSPTGGRYGSRLRPSTQSNAALPQMIKETKYETDDGDVFTEVTVTDITSKSGESSEGGSDVSSFGGGGVDGGYGLSYTKGDAWWARVAACMTDCQKKYRDRLIACGGEDNIERCETKATIAWWTCSRNCNR